MSSCRAGQVEIENSTTVTAAEHLRLPIETDWEELRNNSLPSASHPLFHQHSNLSRWILAVTFRGFAQIGSSKSEIKRHASHKQHGRRHTYHQYQVTVTLRLRSNGSLRCNLLALIPAEFSRHGPEAPGTTTPTSVCSGLGSFFRTSSWVLRRDIPSSQLRHTLGHARAHSPPMGSQGTHP